VSRRTLKYAALLRVVFVYRGSTVVYPRSNRLLFGRVKSGGGIVSEYYLGDAPLQWRFPARNRIIAGLSDVVVVVEAAEKSVL
jgi:DNA processing protein